MDPSERRTAQEPGYEFVLGYYEVMEKAPTILSYAYRPDSEITRPENLNSDEMIVYTLADVGERLNMFSYGSFKSVEITSATPEDTEDGRVKFNVCGCFTSEEGRKKRSFTQVFNLALRYDLLYFVSEDMFRFDDDDVVTSTANKGADVSLKEDADCSLGVSELKNDRPEYVLAKAMPCEYVVKTPEISFDESKEPDDLEKLAADKKAADKKEKRKLEKERKKVRKAEVKKEEEAAQAMQRREEEEKKRVEEEEIFKKRKEEEEALAAKVKEQEKNLKTLKQAKFNSQKDARTLKALNTKKGMVKAEIAKFKMDIVAFKNEHKGNPKDVQEYLDSMQELLADAQQELKQADDDVQAFIDEKNISEAAGETSSPENIPSNIEATNSGLPTKLSGVGSEYGSSTQLPLSPRRSSTLSGYHTPEEDMEQEQRTHLVTPPEILMGRDTNIQDVTNDARGIEVEVKEVGEARSTQNGEESENQASNLNTEMTRDCYPRIEENFIPEESNAPDQSVQAREESGFDSRSSSPKLPESMSSTSSSVSDNEQSQSSNHPVTDSLPQFLDVQETLYQIMVSQKEMHRQLSNSVIEEGKRLEVALGRVIEKSNAAAPWAHFQEETIKNEKALGDHFQQIVNAAMSFMSMELNAMFEKTLKKEFTAVGPALAGAVTPIIEKTVSSAIEFV